MLSFSNGLGKTILGGIVFLIIVVFALEFRAGRGNPTAHLSTECAVDFGGECLDAKDYFAAYGLLVPRGIQPKDVRTLALKRRTLDGLAERELLYAEALRLGIGVSDEVLEQELAAGRAHVSLPAADAEQLAYRLGLCRPQERGYGCEPGTTLGIRQLRVRRTPDEPFDYKLYEREIRILANRGPKEFRAAQEREMVAERMREIVRSRARVSESEARSVFERGRSKAVVRSVVLDGSWFGTYVVDTSDAALERWMGMHGVEIDRAFKDAQKGFEAGCPLVREVVLPLAPQADAEEKGRVREQLTALRTRVQKGEDFARVAREASGAPSAPFGGLVGCLNDAWGPGSDVLVAAAKPLAPGALSDPLETPSGLVLLERVGTLEAGNVEREGRRQVARGLYLVSAENDAMRAFASELIKQAKAGGKLEEIARVLIDDVTRDATATKPKDKAGEATASPAALAANRPHFEVSPPFTISGNPLPDVIAREPLAARAFELEPEGVIESPIETATGFVVMQLKEKTPASKEEFEKEKWALLRVLTDAKGNEALTRYVADLRRAAGNKLKIDLRYGEDTKADPNE